MTEIIELRNDNDDVAETEIDEVKEEVVVTFPDEMEEALAVYEVDPLLNNAVKEIAEAMEMERTKVIWDNLGKKVGIPKSQLELVE